MRSLLVGLEGRQKFEDNRYMQAMHGNSEPGIFIRPLMILFSSLSSLFLGVSLSYSWLELSVPNKRYFFKEFPVPPLR
jgi:hypothetical protein